MKINFNQHLRSLSGKDSLKDEDGKDVMLKAVCIAALLAHFAKEDINGSEKMARFKIAFQIENATEPLELKAEEITKIKELVGKAWSPIIVGRSWELLDSAEK